MSAPVLPPFAQATSGALGSAVSNTLVYPLDLLSTRLQTQSRRPGTPGTPGTPGPDGKQLGATPATKPRGYQSLAGALGEIYKKGGVKGLYQGWQSDTLSNTLSNFLFFYFRSALIEMVRRRKFGKSVLGSGGTSNGNSGNDKKLAAQLTLGAAEDLAVGALAGILSRFFTTPLSNVTVRKQTSSSSPSQDKAAAEKRAHEKALTHARGEGDSSDDEEDDYKDADETGILDSLKEIVQERGVAGLWSGFDTAILLSIVPALTFYLTNFYARLLIPSSAAGGGGKVKGKAPSAWQTFATSAAGNASATLLVFPLILCKTRLQWKSPSGRRVYRNLADVLRKTIKKTGWQGLYQGLNSQLCKGIVGHGVTMMVKQRAETLFVLLFLLVRHRKMPALN